MSLVGGALGGAGRRSFSPYLNLMLLFAIAQVQATIMDDAALAGSVPMLPLLAVVSWGILRGAVAGGWWALCLGWMLDWRSTGPIGSYTLPLLVVAAISALGSRRIFASNLLLPGALTAVGTVCFMLIHLAVVAAGGGQAAWSITGLAQLLMPALALNLLWLPLVFFPLRALAMRMGDAKIGWER